jgi:hypothetical protein
MAGAVSLKNSFLDGACYVSACIVALVSHLVKAMGCRDAMSTQMALLFSQPRIYETKGNSALQLPLCGCKKGGDALSVASQHEHGSAAGRFLPKLGGASAPPFFYLRVKFLKKQCGAWGALFQDTEL